MNGMMKALKPPTLEATEETFGLVHGDFHDGNFLLESGNGERKFPTYDWDFVHKGFFMTDLGTLIV